MGRMRAKQDRFGDAQRRRGLVILIHGDASFIAQGVVQEVRGLGVVGAQPLIEPGRSFEYTSGAAIATAVGTMKGSYQMLATDGTRFEAPIPQFTLSVPRVLH